MDELLHQVLTALRGMWRRRWIGLAVAWAVAVIGAVVLLRIPDRYEATARVFVDTQTVLKPLMSGLAVQPNVDEQISMLARTLIARPNIEKIMRSSDLDVTATYADREGQAGRLRDPAHQVPRRRSREHLQHFLPGRESGPRQARSPGSAFALRRVRRRQQAARFRGSAALYRRADQAATRRSSRKPRTASRNSRSRTSDSPAVAARTYFTRMSGFRRSRQGSGWSCVPRKNRATR